MMKSKKLMSLLAATALASTVLVGCGSSETTLKDGNYEAKSEADERGYVASINIEVKDGKIATVKYDEANDAGSKLDDAEYNENMKNISKTNPVEAYPALEASLIEKQNVADVDTVTGATTSTESFKALAEEALKSAK